MAGGLQTQLFLVLQRAESDHLFEVLAEGGGAHVQVGGECVDGDFGVHVLLEQADGAGDFAAGAAASEQGGEQCPALGVVQQADADFLADQGLELRQQFGLGGQLE